MTSILTLATSTSAVQHPRCCYLFGLSVPLWGTFHFRGFTRQGNLDDADAFVAKASTEHVELRLEIIQGHAFWDHCKADEGLRITVQ